MENEKLMEFGFINALFLFLLIPVLVFIYYKYNSNKKESILKFSTLKIIKKTNTKNNLIRKHIPFLLIIIVLSLIIIALANPQIVTMGSEKGVNLGIVLDGSESMAASDYEPTRLDAAKRAITSLVTKTSQTNNVGVVLFETGAGGSAPKHVEQMVKEGHLRWDSLGEYCALVPSLEMIAQKSGNPNATVLANTLDTAIGAYLENARYPSRKVNEIDNRGSTYYLALYWAQALAAQTEDPALSERFQGIAQQLSTHESIITSELLAAQGQPVDLGGYFRPNQEAAAKAMRPSHTFNTIIDAM